MQYLAPQLKAVTDRTVEKCIRKHGSSYREGGGGREERGGEVIKGGLEEEEECHSKCCNGTTVHLAVRTESWQPLESTLKCKHGCNAKYENDVPYHIRIPPVQQSEVLEEPDFRPQVGVLQAGTQAKLRLELLFRSGFLGIQQLV